MEPVIARRHVVDQRSELERPELGRLAYRLFLPSGLSALFRYLGIVLGGLGHRGVERLALLALQ